jgi:hypothetical protein
MAADKDTFIKYEEFLDGQAQRTTHTYGHGTTNDYLITEGLEPTLVIEDYTKYVAYQWCKDWKKLEEKDQQIIWAIFGKDNLRNLYKTQLLELKSPDKLRRVAMRSFYLMGWNKPCTRCGGTGHYSYNMRHGTTCFKCSGNKLQSVTPTKAELKKFLAKYPEGIKYTEDDVRGKGEYKLKKESAK